MAEIKELGEEYYDRITELFLKVFSGPPWYDDWSNKDQLNAYITELTGNRNSLSYGLFEDGELIGLSLGKIMHWCRGTEYYIDEFCILPQCQGRGLGSFFLKEIEDKAREKGATFIFLQTNTDMPAYRFYKKHGYLELKNHVSFSKDI